MTVYAECQELIESYMKTLDPNDREYKDTYLNIWMRLEALKRHPEINNDSTCVAYFCVAYAKSKYFEYARNILLTVADKILEHMIIQHNESLFRKGE